MGGGHLPLNTKTYLIEMKTISHFVRHTNDVKSDIEGIKECKEGGGAHHHYFKKWWRPSTTSTIGNYAYGMGFPFRYCFAPWRPKNGIILYFLTTMYINQLMN